MHRLFWKIFLAIWSSMIVFVGAGLVSASLYVEHTRTGEHVESPRARLRNYLDEARFIANNDGRKELTRWLRKLDRREVIPIYLVDDNGEDLLDRPVSRYLFEHMERVERRERRNGPVEHSPRRNVVRLNDGSELRLIPDFRAVTLHRVLGRPRVIAFPLIAAALISGLAGLLLARYLTRPMLRLSRASKQYASGDLTMRVAPHLGSRRDEVAQLAHDFDHMAERLQALITSQRQLLSDVSHELRSPLARMQVAVGLVRQRTDEAIDPELERIDREIERLNDMLGRLLSLARLEAGTTTIHSEQVDLRALLTEVAEGADYEASAADRRVRLLDGSVASIEADPTLLLSAVENVVRNASRYTAENTTVEISLTADGPPTTRVRIEVRDQGPGVPEDMLGRLFEPFVRVGDARDRASGGYGLGLAIARRAVQLHGGRISAFNHPEGGLVVRIELPVSESAQSL